MYLGAIIYAFTDSTNLYQARFFKLCMIPATELNTFIPNLVTVIKFQDHCNLEKVNGFFFLNMLLSGLGLRRVSKIDEVAFCNFDCELIESLLFFSVKS